jgi:hypothetical protein
MGSRTVALNMSCPCTEMSAWWWLLVTETCSKHYIVEYIVVLWLKDILISYHITLLLWRNYVSKDYTLNSLDVISKICTIAASVFVYSNAPLYTQYVSEITVYCRITFHTPSSIASLLIPIETKPKKTLSDGHHGAVLHSTITDPKKSSRATCVFVWDRPYRRTRNIKMSCHRTYQVWSTFSQDSQSGVVC